MQLDRQLQSTQQQMRDAGDEYEEAEKRLQEQLREMKEQLDMAQRVWHTFHMLTTIFVQICVYVQYHFVIGNCVE